MARMSIAERGRAVSMIDAGTSIRQIQKAERGKYRANYDTDTMADAFNAVLEENMSVQRAAAVFGIPCTTLKDRVRGRVNLDVIKSGKGPLFSQDQEALLSRHLNTMAELGYGYSRQETITLASDYAVTLGLRKQGDPLSLKWLYGFLDRWPELRVRKPRSLEAARAKSATKPVIEKYFKELERILADHGFHQRPNAIFNCDEKGVSSEHKPPKIVCGSTYKPQAVTSGKSKTVTIIGAGNAMGHQVPPFFVFPGKRMVDGLMTGASTGAIGTVSDSGWSNTEIFGKFVRDHLTKYMPPRDAQTPVLVLYDGHKSHISIGLIEWARQNHVILFVLPPHCSHLLQPLDVSCYGPFEVAYNSACHSYLRQSGGNIITRYDICKIACKVYTATLTPANIQAAFKKCGIYPFNPTVVPDSLVAPSLSFARPATDAPLPSQQPTSEVQTPEKEQQVHSSVIGERFLESRGGEILKNVKVAKVRRTLSKVVAGKAITDETVVDAIKEHLASQAPRKRKEQPTPGPSKFVAPFKKPAKTKTVTVSKSVPQKIDKIIEIIPSDSDSDSEISDSEKCCVCHKFTPDEVRNCTSLIFTKWGQCDECNSWVHLGYCTPVKVIRRGVDFYCPGCTLTRPEI